MTSMTMTQLLVALRKGRLDALRLTSPLGRRYDAFLFDVDGTLLDSEVCFLEAWHIILERRGIDISRFDLGDFRGCGGDEQAIKVIKKLELADDPEALLQEWVQVARPLVMKEVQYCTGAREILDLCHSISMEKAIVTTSSEVYANKILTRMNIIREFEFLVTRTTMEELGTKSKPAPYPYLLACWRLQIPPSRALVFEDSEVGVKSAKTAGCPTIGISHGDSLIAAKMKAAGADIIVETLLHLELDKLTELP